MDWLQIKIVTTNKGIDPIVGKLYELGIVGIEISDKDDFAEFLENNRKYWDYVDEELEKLKYSDTFITIYLSDDLNGREMLGLVRNAMTELKSADEENDYGALNISINNVKDEDWSENWKKYFKPIKVGEKILIVPEWEKINEKTNRTIFTVNPGMSFGTGSHQSTQMCIEEIEKSIKEGDKVLDLGCGSGILSIIALLLGAGDAVAVDIDANAIEVAYSNLKLNGLPDSMYHGFAGDIITDKMLRGKLLENRYDIVIANIVADVIIDLSKFVKEFINDGGIFICSGIIIERKDEVIHAIEESGLKIVEVREKGEWVAVKCN